MCCDEIIFDWTAEWSNDRINYAISVKKALKFLGLCGSLTDSTFSIARDSLVESGNTGLSLSNSSERRQQFGSLCEQLCECGKCIIVASAKRLLVEVSRATIDTIGFDRFRLMPVCLSGLFGGLPGNVLNTSMMFARRCVRDRFRALDAAS